MTKEEVQALNEQRKYRAAELVIKKAKELVRKYPEAGKIRFTLKEV